MPDQCVPPGLSEDFGAGGFPVVVPLPPRLEIKGNLSKDWKQWRQIWDAYEVVTKLRDKPSNLRVATFITCIGKEALEIHNGLPFRTEDEKVDINKVLGNVLHRENKHNLRAI